MASDTPIGKVTLFEDFVRDNVTNLNEAAASSSPQDILNKHGGWWRMIPAGDDADANSISGELAWEADEGSPIIFETRMESSNVSVTSSFVGFSDSVGDSVVIEDEDGTLNTVATDAFGFLLEGEQDATWQRMGVDSDADKVQLALTSGVDAANAVTQTLRLEATPQDSGTVRYFIDGELVSTATSWFDSSLVFCPILSCDDRNTVYNLDFDYLYVSAPREN